MIRLLYPHAYPLRIFINNWLTAYRSSHLYSTFKEGAGVLRHSKFSEFMGLAAQWRKLQKQQQKNEKQEVRSNLMMIAFCLVGLSIGVIFVQNDAAIMLRGFLLSKGMQLSFIKDKQKRFAINKEIIEQFQKFLQDYPYDYLSIIAMLNGYVRASIHNNLEKSLDEERLLNIYENILKRNHSAKSNLQFLQGVSSLLEHCYFQKRPISHQRLLWALLEGGTTKQIFIGIKNLSPNQHITEEQRHLILQNIQTQMKKDAQYFTKIFQKIDEEQIPQISFKKRQTAQWSAQIQSRLNPIP